MLSSEALQANIIEIQYKSSNGIDKASSSNNRSSKMVEPTNLKMKIDKLWSNDNQDQSAKPPKNRLMLIDSHFICYLTSDCNINVHCINSVSIQTSIEDISSRIISIHLLRISSYSLLGILCNDGSIYGYKIAMEENHSKIHLQRILHKVNDGIIEAGKLMWKDANKLGVSLNKEFLMIEVSQDEKDKERDIKPRSFHIFDCEKAYLLFEDGTIRVINTDNGLRIREFVPHKDSDKKAIKLLSYKNLAKASPPIVAGQKIEINKGHDYSLRDIFITIADGLEIKVWDLSEWDNNTQSYYCLQTIQFENKELSSVGGNSIVYDYDKTSLFVLSKKLNEEKIAIISIKIDPYFYVFHEDYHNLKKTVNFFTYISSVDLNLPRDSESTSLQVISCPSSTQDLQTNALNTKCEKEDFCFQYYIHLYNSIVKLSFNELESAKIKENDQGLSQKEIRDLASQEAVEEGKNDVECKAYENQKLLSFNMLSNISNKIDKLEEKVHKLETIIEQNIDAKKQGSYFENFEERLLAKVDQRLNGLIDKISEKITPSKPETFTKNKNDEESYKQIEEQNNKCLAKLQVQEESIYKIKDSLDSILNQLIEIKTNSNAIPIAQTIKEHDNKDIHKSGLLDDNILSSFENRINFQNSTFNGEINNLRPLHNQDYPYSYRVPNDTPNNRNTGTNLFDTNSYSSQYNLFHQYGFVNPGVDNSKASFYRENLTTSNQIYNPQESYKERPLSFNNNTFDQRFFDIPMLEPKSEARVEKTTHINSTNKPPGLDFDDEDKNLEANFLPKGLV